MPTNYFVGNGKKALVRTFGAFDSRFLAADLVETNRRRSKNDMEYELLGTDAFKEDRSRPTPMKCTRP
jgi:hypothetical protein